MEATFLKEWIDGNDEERELLALLHDIVGGGLPVTERVASYTSTLPLCSPPPAIDFTGRLFCMTGKFVFGTRKQCEAAVAERGGECQSAPTSSTSFLVVGAIGSRDWMHSTHGRKIEAAVALRDRGSFLSIELPPSFATRWRPAKQQAEW